jgi:hypothetical protein
MNLSDEIEKLRQLHASGALTDAEFAQAKQAVLSGAAPTPARPPAPTRTETGEDDGFLESMLDGGDRSVGGAANRYVSFQMVMAVFGLILFAILFFAVFLPMWNQNRARQDDIMQRHDEMRQDFNERWDQLAP